MITLERIAYVAREGSYFLRGHGEREKEKRPHILTAVTSLGATLFSVHFL